MLSTILSVAALAGETVFPAQWGPVPREQIAVLEELFTSTDGRKWKDNSGWLVAESACDWYGIQCDVAYVDGKPVSNIVSINLTDNNLRGTLPVSLETLPALQGLDVALNQLKGDVPEGLLARWDAHTLEFRGARNSFGNMIRRARFVFESSGVLCSKVDEDVRYVLDVTEYGPSRFETIRCVPNSDRDTHCLIKEGNGPYLERLSRALAKLGYRSFAREYWPKFTGATHQEFVTTTVWWGDGTEKTVMTYGRQGPTDVWIAQQLFFGLLEDVYWESEHFESECPSSKKN